MDIHQGGDSTGNEKRTLHQDDVDGICHIYPVAENPDICEEPVCGLDVEGTSTECAGQSEGSGCMTIPIGLNKPASVISRLLGLF